MLFSSLVLLVACKDDPAKHSITLGDASVTAGEPAGLEGITALHDQTRAMAYPTPTPALADLAWSDTIAATAQSWANNCQFMHNTTSGYGENIYAAAGFTPTANDAVSSWASESVDYDYASNTCAAGKVCGHYTQIVWRGTTTLGCGIQYCTTNSPFAGFPNWYFVVCDYDPPGNSGGKPY